MEKLPFNERQIHLCESAAKVEESFADCGEAHDYLIAECAEAGFLRKVKSKDAPYQFTDAGCIAVALWNVHHTSTRLHAEQKATIARLREALEPFANAVDCLDDPMRDTSEIWEHSSAMAITAGDLRRARTAISHEGA